MMPSRRGADLAFRHIGKRAAPVVLVQPVRGTGTYIRRACAAEKDNVEPAVAVVVDKGAAAADRFDDRVLVLDRSVNIGDGEAGVSCDIGEAGKELDARGLAAGHRLNAARGDSLGRRSSAAAEASVNHFRRETRITLPGRTRRTCRGPARAGRGFPVRFLLRAGACRRAHGRHWRVR